MRTIAFTAFGILVLAYVVFVVPMMLRFFEYCGRVAVATGRVAEWQSSKYIDDGRFNAFQMEQWGALMRKDHVNLSDRTLIDEGEILSRRLRASRTYAIALVVLAAILDVTTR